MSNFTPAVDGSPDDEPDAPTDAGLDDETGASAAHLDDIEDGAGCTEIWETLSERREADRREASERASGGAVTAEDEK